MEAIKLNLVPSDLTKPICHASQFDDGREIMLMLYDGQMPYVLSDEEIELDVKKLDGNIVTTDLTVESGTNHVIMVTTEQMCAIAGRNNCELKVQKDGKTIHSKNFYLAVEESATAGGIESASQINNLQTQIAGMVEDAVENQYDSENVIFDSTPTAEHGTGYTVTSAGIKAAIDAAGGNVIDDTTPESNKTYSSEKVEALLENKADTDDIPTKTSDLENDSGFAQIDDTTESATKTYSSGMSENKFATVFENILGDAGKFKPQNSWYATAGATGYSSANGVATFTTTAQYGGIRPASPISQTEGHKYYLFGKVKASMNICLSFDGTGAVFSTGTGEWEYISIIYTSNATRTRYVTVSDNNATGHGTVQAKNIGVIDLTAIYGDDVPTKEVLDAKIAPMGALASSAIGTLTNRLYTDVEKLKSDVATLEDFVDTRTFKVIALGDSITAFGTGSRGWLKYFKEKIPCDIIANTAVDGAWLNDKEAGTVYDGNPIAGNNNLNVLGNQVQKILNNNYDAPDLIMIAVGTNSGISISSQDMYDVYYYNYQTVDLENVDRTTSAGAYRWCLEKLHTKYPDAIIIWCSPIHGAEPATKSANQIAAWSESLRIATQYTGQQYIESYRCGINGWKEVYNGEGEYLQDGLHPNAKGAKKLGYYNASQVKNILMQVFST